MKNANEFKIGVIYMYTSPSGKKYVGQTIREKQRKYEHKTETSKTKTAFGNAIRKYGFENLEYKVLIKFKPTVDKKKLKRILDKLEQRYIKIYRTDEKELGYNLNKGGDGNLGYKHTEEELLIMKGISQEKMNDPEQREQILDNLSKGQHLCQTISEETKQKMSAVKKNKKGVQQYDLEMQLVNTFSSIAEAAKSIDSTSTLKTRSNRISECINGKWKTAYNYMWVKL